MRATVHVRGLRELQRALKGVDSGLAKVLRDGLKQAAGPVLEDASRRLDRFAGIGALKPVVTQRAVFVRQSRSKVTGRRPDFGATQMRVGLIPAAQAKEDETVKEVEHVLDALIRREGF